MNDKHETQNSQLRTRNRSNAWVSNSRTMKPVVYTFWKNWPTGCASRNSAAIYGGGLAYCSHETVKNSILWLNSPEEVYDSEGLSVTYSDVRGGYEGEGNIDLPPLFVGADDYHLQSGSPCIDTANPDGAPDTDLDGNSRPQGTGFDMGAYEYVAGGTPPTADAGADQIVFNRVTLDGSGSSDPDGSIVTYEWQLDHRTDPAYSRTATGVKPTVSNLKKGYYDVTLTVTDDQGATDTDTMLLAVSGNRVVVVPLFSGD